MKVVSIDLDILSRTYFYFDEPVDYKLENYNLKIFPITVRQSEIFLSSINLFSIDKNSTPSAEIIQMSYLQFILDVLIPNNKDNLQKFINLLVLCLNMKKPIVKREKNNRPILIDGNNGYTINPLQFEDIRRIILYQNLIGFDDSYINPDLKKAMEETDELKNKNIDYPNLERKIAIITSHTGLSKKEQLDMSYRSHTMLFEEIYREVEFTTSRPIALLGNNEDKIDHWILKKKKNKMEGYVTQVDKYAQSMGSNQYAIKNINGQTSGQFLQQFNNFNK